MLVAADALSGAILPGGTTTKRLALIFSMETAKSLGTGLPQLLVSVVSFAAIVLVYLELVVRNVLVRLVVALAPLTFAAIVWPGARGAGRRLLEFVVAAILAKPAIFIALRVGIDLVEEHAFQSSLVNGASWGKLFVGLAVACVAAFTPWVVWRLLPHAEAALIAQGMSRAPMRAGMQVLQTAYWAEAIRARGQRNSGQPAAESSTQRSGLGPARSLPSTTGAGGGAAASGGAAGGGAATGGAAATVGGSAAAAGAAGAVAAPVAVVAAAKGAKDHVTSAADRQTSGSSGSPGGAAGSSGSSGSSGASSGNAAAPPTGKSRPSDGWTRRPPGPGGAGGPSAGGGS
jgi:hypothetical protein